MIQNARVLVIDDVHDEVEKLLWILNKNGLCFNYYKGDEKKELPKKPLRGVRFVFLDFILGTDGQSDDNKIAVLMNVLKTTIATDNGPYIILAWTKHDTSQDTLLPLFKQKLMQSTSIPRPMAILNMQKRDCMKSLHRIERNLNDKISGKEILEILIDWENHAGNASGEVLRTLSEMSKPQTNPDQSYDDYSAEWNTGLERHLYWIAVSALGENLQPNKNMLIAAQTAFTELLRDHIEFEIKKGEMDADFLLNKLEGYKTRQYTPEEKAFMHSYFHLISRNIDPDIQPGNIYRAGDIFKKIKCGTRECYINKTRITPLQIVSDIYEGKLANYAKKKLLLKGVIPIFMEITAECDYANKKWKNTIMLMGVLWPDTIDGEKDVYKRIKGKAGFLYKPFPIRFDGKTYYITFNAHYLVNMNFKIFDDITPIFKARKELLVDVQQWFSRQASRPGKMEF